MTGGPRRALALRLALGFAGAILAGLLAFRQAVLVPGRPAFQCVKVGLVAAVLLALVRAGRMREAVLAATIWVALETARGSQPDGIRMLVPPMWSAAVALGLLAVSVVFHRMAEGGVRFGKFLVTGPLLGGVILAATPIALLGARGTPVGRELLFNVLLGIVIGDGVGLGVEIADLALDRGTPDPAKGVRLS